MPSPESPRLISPTTALLSAFLFTALYVAPFYLSPTLRSVSLAARDSPSVIRARVRSVTLTCLACALLNISLLAFHAHATPRDVLRLWGLYPISLPDIVKLLALVSVLFIGPLFKTLIVEGEYRFLTPSNLKTSLFSSWIAYRNLIIAPLSEEFVFRSLVISLYLVANVSPVRIIFTTPLIFGMAHLHHLAANIRGRTPPNRGSPPFIVWLQCIAISLFQFTYTSLFGFFAAFALLRTGNFYGVVLVHSFCNWMGVPQFWGRIGQSMYVTPDFAQNGRDEGPGGSVKVGEREAGPWNLADAWTVAYYVLLVGGAYGFYALLFPWTASANALAVI
jgi:prenyl protein peptidase